MLLGRKVAVPVLVLLLLIGSSLAFDRRFLSSSDVRSKPVFALYVYAPTLFFSFLGAVQFLRGRLWPATAFARGLIATGILHQQVAAESYGNPGYMIPGGHIFAPLLSDLAYSVSFGVAWALTHAFSKRRKNQRVSWSLCSISAA